MKQNQSIKTVFVDVNGVQYTVELLGDGKAALYDSGYIIFKGTVSQIKAMGIVPKIEQNKLLTQRIA